VSCYSVPSTTVSTHSVTEVIDAPFGFGPHAAYNAPCLVILFQAQQYQHIQSLRLFDAPFGFGPHAAYNAPCLVILFQAQQYQHIQSLRLFDAPFGFGPHGDTAG